MPPKVIFRTLNRIHIFIYRSSGGKILGKVAGSPVLLLTTIGRKTGQERTVPLIYNYDDQRYAVIASHHPTWYSNLKSNPVATIEVKGQTYPVTARDADAEEALKWWAKIVQQSPMFDAYREHPDHKIIVLEPVQP